MPVTSICNRCGLEFKHPKCQQRVFCGRECAHKAQWQDSEAANSNMDRALYKSVRGYENGARARNLEWELTYDQCALLFPAPCYLCGKAGPGGIDRIDSAKGYRGDNVRPCCADCNLLKGAVHLAPFLRHIQKIHAHCTAEGYYDVFETAESLVK